MSKKPFPWSSILFVVCVFLFVCIVVVFSEHRSNGIVNEGKEAYKSGISDAANPYELTRDRVLWLRGWADAKNEK